MRCSKSFTILQGDDIRSVPERDVGRELDPAPVSRRRNVVDKLDAVAVVVIACRVRSRSRIPGVSALHGRARVQRDELHRSAGQVPDGGWLLLEQV